MDVHSAEDRDGVRLTWNVWPSSRLEGSRIVLPLGCQFTPMKRSAEAPVPVVAYEPVTCRKCHAVLNPHAQVDVASKVWACQFCLNRNALPPQYADITATNLPAELIPAYTTMEYRLPRTAAPAPVFLFVIDLVNEEDELQALKDSLLMTMALLPPNARVGLVTFGNTVQVYELAFTAMPKAYVFAGDKDVSPETVRRYLGLGALSHAQGGAQAAAAAAMAAPGGQRFLMELSQCQAHLESIIEELQADATPVAQGHRALRATGAAMAVSVALLEAAATNQGGRLLLFLSGPCTHGPGLVLSHEKKEMIRTHHDISKDRIPHMAKATAYYKQLALRLAQAGHAADFFCCSLDQMGTLEMEDFLRLTGGVIVMEDSFGGQVFQQSLCKLFQRNEHGEWEMGLSATLSVHVCKEVKVMGAIGHCISGETKSTAVSDSEIGVGGTTSWRIAALDPRSTLSVFFEVVNQHTNGIPAGQMGNIQFLTQYHTCTGQRMLRVTTIVRPWADFTVEPLRALADVGSGFDQEAAAVMVSRMAVWKTDSEAPFDIIRWVDRTLIRLVAKFAQFTKGQPESFALQTNFSLFPQFLFHLRRSNFLNVFNESPDETSMKRHTLLRESTGNCLTMIQPTLDRYSFDGPPEPVLLAADSLQDKCILLLDTFFSVVVWYGATIADWRKKGYQDKPEYASFAQLIQAPKDDAAAIVNERLPIPWYVETDQGTSQARRLTAVVDPTITFTSANAQGGGERIFTEDVNLEVFMDHLRKLSVNQ